MKLFKVSMAWTCLSAFWWESVILEGMKAASFFSLTKCSYITSVFSYPFNNYSSVMSPILEVQSASTAINTLVMKIPLWKCHQKGLILSLHF